jgi:hypothetical protein
MIELCTQCGYSHVNTNRRRQIGRMVNNGIAARTIKEAWPCFYPHVKDNDASDMRLFRDIAKVKEERA